MFKHMFKLLDLITLMDTSLISVLLMLAFRLLCLEKI